MGLHRRWKSNSRRRGLRRGRWTRSSTSLSASEADGARPREESEPPANTSCKYCRATVVHHTSTPFPALPCMHDLISLCVHQSINILSVVVVMSGLICNSHGLHASISHYRFKYPPTAHRYYSIEVLSVDPRLLKQGQSTGLRYAKKIVAKSCP